MKITANFKYYCEHQWNDNILIMLTYLIMSKLICIITDYETFYETALEQVRSVYPGPIQTSRIILFQK